MYADRRVDEELLNCCSAVHVFGLAKLSERVEFVPPNWKPSVPDEESVDPTARVEVPVVFSVPTPPAV